jgi:hypothetical protein
VPGASSPHHRVRLGVMRAEAADRDLDRAIEERQAAASPIMGLTLEICSCRARSGIGAVASSVTAARAEGARAAGRHRRFSPPR